MIFFFYLTYLPIIVQDFLLFTYSFFVFIFIIFFFIILFITVALIDFGVILLTKFKVRFD